MKFIKGKLSLLYPLFLLLFYFYVRPQFRPFGPVCLQQCSKRQQLLLDLIWPRRPLCSLYRIFWSIVFLKKRSFKLGKNPLQALIRSRFCGLFGLLVGLLHQWFCSRTGSCFESLSTGNWSHRGAYLSDRNGRHPAGDRRADLSWSLGECLLQRLETLCRDLASSPHLQWPAFSPQSFFAGSFYHLSPAECDFWDPVLSE